MRHDTSLRAARGRLRVLGLFIALGFLFIAFALMYWTIFRGSSILVRDDNPRLVQQELNIRRGRILDTNNNILAETVGSPGSLLRVYPIAESGPAVGYYSFRHGTTGIEEGLDSELRGEVGNPWDGWWHNEVLHEEVIGRDVRLTLDTRWQQAADELLGEFRGSVVLFTIPDFAIRAMASKPGYDPNQLDESFDTLAQDERAPLVNRVAQGLYQPGLVIQPFVVARALADGLIALEESVQDADKTVALNGYLLSCDQQLEGEVDWLTVVRYHCPYPLTQLARQIGEDGIMETYDAFGLFEPPRLPIATVTGERQAVVSLDLAGIGQDEQTVSPLQIARALASLAGGGQLPQFRLVSATQNEEGLWESVNSDNLSAHVIPADVARAVLEALPIKQGITEHSVLVLSGPGGSTNSWYLGLAPANAPRYGVVVVVEDTNGQHSADQIGQRILKLALNVESEN
jgi:peptidoglycan glycosyltransferase